MAVYIIICLNPLDDEALAREIRARNGIKLSNGTYAISQDKATRLKVALELRDSAGLSEAPVVDPYNEKNPLRLNLNDEAKEWIKKHS